MHSSKGSFSLVYLVVIIYLTLFAQLMLQHLKNDYERSYTYVQGLQQRRLCGSVINWLVTNQKGPGTLHFTYTFPPSKDVALVEGEHSVSSDAFFDYYYAQVQLGNNNQKLYRLGFYPSQELKNYGQQYMFISKYTPTGTNYLNDSTLYTSMGSFSMPSLSFLSDKASTTLDMQAIHENGFSNNIVYLQQATTLTYLSTAKQTKGNSLIACTRSITLQKNFRATDRIVLISNESITLQENVNLANALIIAKGNVVIGKGCRINGAVFSSSTIKFQGSGTFTKDTSVVADYVSALNIA